MKLCQTCGQSVAEEITLCPSCGSDIGKGREYIDDYRIVEVLHEGYASFLCKAVRERTGEKVMIRLFTPQSGVDEDIADRLGRELNELRALPYEGFVRHYAVRRSEDGLWYRISEWIDNESWGELVGSGSLGDLRVAVNLFTKIAARLEILHEYGLFIPHLILDDIMVFEDENGELDVKIDYKLSRFLDPKLDKPGPTLEHLLACHPDITNERPLDFRSDIWSLAKVFVELLTADYETFDYLSKIQDIPLPPDIKTLLRVMLAEDPDLRPRSMSEVVRTLSRLTDLDIERAERQYREMAATSARTITRLKRRQWLLAAVVLLLLIVAGVSWFYPGLLEKDDESLLQEYANAYAPSIGFLLVEYRLKEGDQTFYRKRAEGTAFLVDREGYLLTNRHVACPWLEDTDLFQAINQLKQAGHVPEFDYRMFLWFEGERAFNRSAGLLESPNLDDAYFLGTAFRTDGPHTLRIVGVANPPSETRRIVTSPLKEDFAVLKIDRPPTGLKPLPLDKTSNPMTIPKLSMVITLGFPLGSQSQGATVNVSGARGHIRRTFEDLIQVDAAFYGGNSGGPLIDKRGKVIGIASGVAMERSPGIIPVVTPLWNMAMVQPIRKASDFLQELKEGRIKWNGVLNLAVESTLREVTESAFAGHWGDAADMVDKALEKSMDPALVLAGGMLHFCAGDKRGAAQHFRQSLSMNPENHVAGLMLYIIDWEGGRSRVNERRDTLLSLDWRSPAEFLGFLVRVLEGMIQEEEALIGWEAEDEKSWVRYILSLIRYHQEDLEGAERLLKEAVLAADKDAWEFYLAKARLHQLQKQRLALIENRKDWADYQSQVRAFDRAVQENQQDRERRGGKLVQLQARLRKPSANPKEKKEVLGQLLALYPREKNLLAGLSYYSAMLEEWEQALTFARRYLETGGRENKNRLSLGLFEGLILHHLGRRSMSRAALETFHERTRDLWYRMLSACLLGERTEESLIVESKGIPENILTLHNALGFREEGAGNMDIALDHYRKALASFSDTWIEFEFARERIKKLRREP